MVFFETKKNIYLIKFILILIILREDLGEKILLKNDQIKNLNQEISDQKDEIKFLKNFKTEKKESIIDNKKLGLLLEEIEKLKQENTILKNNFNKEKLLKESEKNLDYINQLENKNCKLVSKIKLLQNQIEQTANKTIKKIPLIPKIEIEKCDLLTAPISIEKKHIKNKLK